MSVTQRVDAWQDSVDGETKSMNTVMRLSHIVLGCLTLARTLERELNAALYKPWIPTTDIDALPPFDLYVLVSSKCGQVSTMHRARGGHGAWSWHSHGKSFSQSFIVGWMHAPKAMEVQS